MWRDSLHIDEFLAALPATYPSAGNYILSGFTPASTYNCSVFASTSGGSGPAATYTVTLLDDIPGPVLELTMTSISATILQIMWSSPEVTNGQIQAYSVLIETRAGSVYQQEVSGDQLTHIVTNLDKYIPYNVSVRARTSAGYGSAVRNVTFTEEGAPNTAPKQVSIIWMNTTHVNVSWVKLTLEEARGFVTYYTVKCDSISSCRKRAVRVEVVDPESSHKVIGLGITESYSITVSASTSTREGTSSLPFILTAPQYLTFQLRITGINTCSQWIYLETLEKIQSISQQIASKMSRDCQCALDATYISSGRLTCDPQQTAHVVYRARLSGTPEVSTAELAALLEEWVASGSASVTLEHVQLNMDPSCSVVIDSFDSPVCPSPTTDLPNFATAATKASTEQNDNNLYWIVTLALVSFVIILIVAVVCGVAIYQKKVVPKGNSVNLIRTRPRVKQQQQELTDIYENLSLHSSSGGRGAVIPNCKTLDSESNDYEPLDSINPVFVAYEKDDKQPRG